MVELVTACRNDRMSLPELSHQCACASQARAASVKAWWLYGSVSPSLVNRTGRDWATVAVPASPMFNETRRGCVLDATLTYRLSQLVSQQAWTEPDKGSPLHNYAGRGNDVAEMACH